MPVMPRPKKAKAISNKIMKKNGDDSVEPVKKERKVDREDKFARDIRTMIKR